MGSGGDGQWHPPPLASAELELLLPHELRLMQPRGRGLIARRSWMGPAAATAAAPHEGTLGSPWRQGSSLPSWRRP